MAITFDGPNLVIVLDASTQVEVQDIYSAWKEWQLAGNMGYPTAFRTVGGDPLTPGITAGAYYFLNNSAGWRIRPPEQDITIYLAGNLAPEDSALPILVPTVGDYSVLVAGLQPVTQNVSALLTMQEEVQYAGAVSIDTIGGIAGTAYPIGTESEPVSNLADALVIADTYGFTRLRLKGFITLTRSFAYWRIESAASFAEVNINGQDVSGCEFRGCGVQGSIPTLTARVAIREGRIGQLTNFWGIIAQCVFEYPTLTLQECHVGPLGVVDPTIIADSGPSMSTPLALDCQDNEVQVNVGPVYGRMALRNNSQAGNVILFDVLGGEISLEATCTAGLMRVSGVGHLVDSSGPSCTVVHNLVETENLEHTHAMLRNRREVNPSNGVETLFESDSVTPKFTRQTYEDVAGTQPYRGQGIERVERYS